jgi:hypothetical protein
MMATAAAKEVPFTLNESLAFAVHAFSTKAAVERKLTWLSKITVN